MKTKVRSEVQRFAEKMEEVLQRHDAKKGEQGWKNLDPAYLFKIALVEMAELGDQLIRGTDPIQLGVECTDVANICMMIADIFGQLPTEDAK